MKTCLLPGLVALAVSGAASIVLRPAVAAPPVTPPVFSNPLDITNPYHPFTPGGVKVYQGVSDGERTAVVDLYLTGTRTFNVGGVDVQTRILQETEFEGGVLVEVSLNYFAQANDGTVYYFGEVVDDYEGGIVVGHEGSWLVGGPTQPGDPLDAGNAPAPAVFMPGTPELGDVFKPEDLFPLVDETSTVTGVNQRVVVPGGRFRNALRIRETSRLSPGHEDKWWAPGLGVVQTKQKGEWLKLIAAHL